MRSTLTDNIVERHVPVSTRDPLSHMTIHRYSVQPSDLGITGVVDGGTLLEWIHRAAHATAARWSGRRCVAASVANFHLDRPISAGEMVEVHACLAYTRHSSLHVLVTIYAGRTGAAAVQTFQCPTVFVAVDDVGSPVAVPQWTPVTMLELQRQHQARVRIRMRRRVEDAIAAQSYTADGAAPSTIRRLRVSRADANRDGTVHGGRCMRRIDEIANMCAADWARIAGVTSYVAAIRFCRSIVIGDQIEVSARMIHTGTRSIHIGVRVVVTDVVSGARCVAAEGVVVVVSVDERGDARSVPEWTADCDEDLRLDRHARHLAELRQFFEPYSNATDTPLATVGMERGFEEGEF